MSSLNEIKSAIEKYLRDDEWHYTLDKENNVIRCGVNLSNRLQECKIIIDIREDKYMVYGLINLNCDEPNKNQMAKLLAMINYGLIFGNFEIDYSDGEVRYKTATNCKNCIPSKEVIEDSIMIPAYMFNKFGDAIIEVMFGIKDAQEAFDDIPEND